MPLLCGSDVKERVNTNTSKLLGFTNNVATLTNSKYLLMMCNDADSTSPRSHGRDMCPLVGIWAVIFASTHTLYAIKSTHNVNLACK